MEMYDIIRVMSFDMSTEDITAVHRLRRKTSKVNCVCVCKISGAQESYTYTDLCCSTIAQLIPRRASTVC